MLKYGTSEILISDYKQFSKKSDASNYAHQTYFEYIFEVLKPNHEHAIKLEPLKIFKVVISHYQENVLDSSDKTDVTTLNCFFSLTGTKQDFLDADFNYFKYLLEKANGQAQGAYAAFRIANDFRTLQIPDLDFSKEETKLMYLKNEFIDSEF